VGCLCQLRTADRAAGDLVVADLRAAGLRVWYDKDYITAGDQIREKINEGIKKSTSFLLLASSHSLKSRGVLNELDVAMVREIEERRKVVIPLLLGKIEPSDLPGDLRGKNWLDLRRGFAKQYQNCRLSLLRAQLAEWKCHVLVGASAGILLIAAQGLMLWQVPIDPQHAFTYRVRKGSPLLWVFILISGAFSEEMWIALCLIVLTPTTHSVTISVATTIVVFAAAHYSYRLWGAVAVAVKGAVSAILFLHFGSIIVTFFDHFVANLGSLYWNRYWRGNAIAETWLYILCCGLNDTHDRPDLTANPSSLQAPCMSPISTKSFAT
jgi:membrane protease YdiL (CAAX protease family)